MFPRKKYPSRRMPSMRLSDMNSKTLDSHGRLIRFSQISYEYLPFNAGPRICIGQQFALTQMALITFRLLQAFKAIERRDDRPPIQKLGVNLSMMYGCLVSVTPA